MTAIIKKMKKGKAYYYAVQSARVKGKPRIIWQKYLGSVEAILQRYQESAPVKPSEIDLFDAGGVATLLKFADRLGLIQLINNIVPSKGQGASLGHYIVLAALNRALEPTSKLQIGDWYRGTVLQRLWGFPSDTFTSQSYWNYMDRISSEDIEKIQDALALNIRQEFRIDTEALLYDTTNFFTYIATRNDRNEIAQRGRQKQKRNDLRQVNLALLTTNEFQIPLFHTTYQGNVPDVAIFPEITQELLRRREKLFGPCKRVMMVFDKGNLTDEMFGKLLYSNIDFIGGVKADLLPEVFELPVDQLTELTFIPGTKAYDHMCEMFGKPCRAVVCYSESFFAQQLNVLTSNMAKCEERLKSLQRSLLMAMTGKTRRKRLTKLQIKAAVMNILSGQYMKDIFKVQLNFEGTAYIKYEVDHEAFERITKTRLGRTVLFYTATNRVGHRFAIIDIANPWRFHNGRWAVQTLDSVSENGGCTPFIKRRVHRCA